VDFPEDGGEAVDWGGGGAIEGYAELICWILT